MHHFYSVVCSQLGFGIAFRTETYRYIIDSNSLPTWLDEVQCTSGDHYLYDCSHDGWYKHMFCSEDAGVQCRGTGVLWIKYGNWHNLSHCRL